MSDTPTPSAAGCRHLRCNLHRLVSVLKTAGLILTTNGWPIPCQK